ncbi:MAG: ribosome rescue protein RqcH [Candidatus Hadarchaeales archaeon]
MKLAMSRLDIMVCVSELENCIGARVERIYEVDGSIVILLRQQEERMSLVCEMGRRISLTRRAPRAPRIPTSFAMLLRKHLMNSVLSGVEQPELERVVWLEFSGDERKVLVVELFGRGNIVLCDGSMRIIHPYRAEAWRGRALRAGETYSLPPGPRPRLEGMGMSEFRGLIRGAPDVVRGLAVNLGLGGTLAEEICARARVGRELNPASATDEDVKALLSAISQVFASEPDPRIVYEDGRPLDVIPFDFSIYLGREIRRFSTFNDALDEYFTHIAESAAAERASKRLEEELERLRRRLADEQASFSSLYERSVQMKRKADLISVRHQFLDGLLAEMRSLLRKAGPERCMEEVRRAAAEGKGWAGSVKGIRRSGEVVVEVSGEEIALNPGITAFQNALRYYDEYKRLAERSAGARRAMERTAAELERLQREGLSAFQPQPRTERLWFERYRWAISSGGFLILAGRDRKTGFELVAKRMGPGDIYLHAEIKGAPHVIIRSGGREIPEDDLREAAEFAAMHSSAWGDGMGSLRVFWVRSDQVSRRAPSGMYLPKGSFMVTGERRYIDVPLRAAVGVVGLEGREAVMCGPVSAVRKRSRIAIEILPGGRNKRDVAGEIAKRLAEEGFDVPAGEVERVMPPGGCRILS